MVYKVLINLFNGQNVKSENVKDLKCTLLENLQKYSSREGSEVYIAVAYIKKNGLNQIKKYIEELLLNDGKIRILTCLDFGLTDIEALQELQKLENAENLKIRIYVDRQTHYHPKFYLFRNMKMSSFIVGSNNLSFSALEQNVECAIYEENSKLVQDLYVYFIELWKKSISIDDSTINEYSKVVQEKTIQEEEYLNKLDSILMEEQERNYVEKNAALVSLTQDRIDEFHIMNNLEKNLVRWKGVDVQDVLAILNETAIMKKYTTSQFLTKLIEENKLHNVKLKESLSWNDYSRFMNSIGFWKNDQITKLGKLALNKYSYSYLDFLQILQFSILVIGNMYDFCAFASQKNKEHILYQESSDISEYLEERGITINENTNIERYFPDILNQFGLDVFLKKRDGNGHRLNLNAMGDFIQDYSHDIISFLSDLED